MDEHPPVWTVTLNPAVDRTLFCNSFEAGRVNRVAREESHAGGKGLNVATFLADYGCRVTATGFLGKANAGLFAEHCRRHGIENRFHALPGTTRTGIKIVDEQQSRTTDINFPGLPVSPEALEQLRGRLDRALLPGAWCVLSGSLPPGAPADTYATLVDIARAKKAYIALDTSGNALSQALAHGPDLVKPNVDELCRWSGQPLETVQDCIAVAEEIREAGVSTVVVSMGAGGALFLEDDCTLVARPPAVAALSTVGAGDAMLAGLVAGMRKGLSLEQRATLATAFSLQAVTRTSPGLNASRLPNDLSQIEIRRQ